MKHCLTRRAAALALGLPLLAAAQGRADPAPPKAPARAPAPAPAYASAFADYKPYQDIAPGDWRRLNDTVGRAALKPGPHLHVPAPAPSGGRP